MKKILLIFLIITFASCKKKEIPCDKPPMFDQGDEVVFKLDKNRKGLITTVVMWDCGVYHYMVTYFDNTGQSHTDHVSSMEIEKND